MNTIDSNRFNYTWPFSIANFPSSIFEQNCRRTRNFAFIRKIENHSRHSSSIINSKITITIHSVLPRNENWIENSCACVKVLSGLNGNRTNRSRSLSRLDVQTTVICICVKIVVHFISSSTEKFNHSNGTYKWFDFRWTKRIAESLLSMCRIARLRLCIRKLAILNGRPDNVEISTASASASCPVDQSSQLSRFRWHF